MSAILCTVRQCARSVIQVPLTSVNVLRHAWAAGCRQYSDDTSFKEYTPEPFNVPPRKYYGYEYKGFTGGPLPRIKDRAVRSLPQYKPKNNWSEEKALFGQNDYIDILGDGNIQPKDLIKGPPHLIGWRGTELQRYIRQMKFEGRRLYTHEPTKWHELNKNIKYLMKKWNRRRKRR